MRISTVVGVLAAGVLIGGVTAPTAAAQSTCADLGGTVDADQVCQVHTANATYTLDYTFSTTYPDQAAVVGYLSQTRDGFINVSDMPGSRDQPYVLDARGTSYSSSGTPGLPPRTQSLVLEVFQDVGGAQPETWYKAFNYDLGKRAPITFDTLFKPGTRPLDVIFPIVQRDLEMQSGIVHSTSQSAGMDPAHYQNFAITDDAVIFFFDRGALVADSAGALQASVPRSAVASLLA
ncbi:RsiV family protein [Mycolicibacterium goodii]|uniref:esterase n=1 Tax=Mycolicibacterium goodii TaxID=134601 RepID=UPI001BDCFB92|nr:esterase [Mycolicibacterium goodii]MBU8816207.1 RsiV family protein [Mycolicibacterium goodii]ULN49838.1 RsiV family protein [Mycolicibacterium goodii]